MGNDWREYQEQAASFFRDLGMSAMSDERLHGVRTSHDVDVAIRGEYAGFSVLWIVECKRWRTRVSKLHVLALREIVSDLGADRGILLAEQGFQLGALEAARLTNVQLTSIAELRRLAEPEIYAVRVMELYDRVQDCNSRYWALDKHRRIEAGLRPDSGASGYSGNVVVALCEDLLKQAMRGAYPVKTNILYRSYRLPESFPAVRELYETVSHFIDDLEARLRRAEADLRDRT